MLPLICRVITCSPHACYLFTQLTLCFLMFSRSQTGPAGGLQSPTCQLLSESEGGGGGLHANIRVRRILWDRGSITVLSPTHTSVCFPKASEVFKNKHIFVASDPGSDHYLCVCAHVSMWDFVCEIMRPMSVLQNEQQG